MGLCRCVWKAAQETRTPLLNRMAPPTPNRAPEGGEVLSAGRARGLAAKSRNQPQAHERVSVSAPLKGSLRRAAPLTGPSTHSFRSRLRP